MPKRLAVLTAILAAFLGVATPALAQEETVSGDQYAPELDCSRPVGQEAPPVPPATPVPDGSTVTPSDDDLDRCAGITGNVQSQSEAFDAPASCGACGAFVAQVAEDAVTGDGSAGDDSTGAFGAALNAARSSGGAREAAASEDTSSDGIEDTGAYQAAFDAAKKAGADDETAKEAAEQAVAEADDSGADKASKVRKGRAVKEAAAEGKTRKDRASKADNGKDKPRKDKTRKDTAVDDEETTEDTDEEVAAGADDGGSGSEDAEAASTGGHASLLLGGVAFLSVGGYAALRVARSWSPVRGRRLLRNQGVDG